MLYERAHVNVQTNEITIPSEVEEAKKKEQEPIFGWHTDSQPFVCIVMLSSPPPDAMGGQTYVKKASGEIVKLSFPSAGYAYLLQGSVLPHAAMPALNYERETMITSFVPTDARFRECTNLDLAINYSPIEETLREFVGHKRNYVKKRLGLLDDIDPSSVEGVEQIEKVIDDLVEDLANTKRSMDAVKKAIEAR